MVTAVFTAWSLRCLLSVIVSVSADQLTQALINDCRLNWNKTPGSRCQSKLLPLSCQSAHGRGHGSDQTNPLMGLVLLCERGAPPPPVHMQTGELQFLTSDPNISVVNLYPSKQRD